MKWHNYVPWSGWNQAGVRNHSLPFEHRCYTSSKQTSFLWPGGQKKNIVASSPFVSLLFLCLLLESSLTCIVFILILKYQICEVIFLPFHLFITKRKEKKCKFNAIIRQQYLTVNFDSISQDTINFVRFLFSTMPCYSFSKHGKFRRACTLYSLPPLYLIEGCFTVTILLMACYK